MKVMLTTIDNPFDPFTEFTNWFEFDVLKGYNSCQYLQRIANVSDYFTEEEQEARINEAIDEIIRLNPLKIYKKVEKKEKN